MPAPDGRMSFSSPLRLADLLDDDAGDSPRRRRSRLPRSAPAAGRSPGRSGTARAGGRSTSSKPSRRMCLDQHAELQFAAAGDLEGVACRRSRRTRMATLPSASRSRRSRITRRLHLVALAAGQRAVVDREGHGQGRRIDRLGRHRLGRPSRSQIVSATVASWTGRRWRRCRRPRPLRSAARSRPRKASTLVMRPLLDLLAVAASALIGMFGLDRAGLDAAGQHAAEEGVGSRASSPASRTARRSASTVRRRHVARRSGRTAAPGPCARPSSEVAAQPLRPEA